MVGIGTSDINLDKYRHSFCSLLGKDSDSWGLSYTGKEGRVIVLGSALTSWFKKAGDGFNSLQLTLAPPPGLLHHQGDKMSFSSRFGQGSIIGVHLDTWHGTLTFFKNRKCIGESRLPVLLSL